MPSLHSAQRERGLILWALVLASFFHWICLLSPLPQTGIIDFQAMSIFAQDVRPFSG